MTKNGIISQDRVKAYGEVFTPDSIVNDMMDAVDSRINPERSDKDYINTIVLEPACGDGQFLIRILYRKLERIKKLPMQERQLHLIKALCSTIGVDIQKDNVENAKKRLRAIAIGEAVETFDLDNQIRVIQINLEIDYSEKLLKVIDYILDRNIICGNTLDTNNPVILTDYKFTGEMVCVAECSINNLTYELTKSQEVNYLDLASIKQITDTDDELYEF